VYPCPLFRRSSQKTRQILPHLWFRQEHPHLSERGRADFLEERGRARTRGCLTTLGLKEREQTDAERTTPAGLS
jgi:hypothetical protein